MLLYRYWRACVPNYLSVEHFLGMKNLILKFVDLTHSENRTDQNGSLCREIVLLTDICLGPQQVQYHHLQFSNSFVGPMANRTAGFGSHAYIWIPSETLEPMFHRVFIWLETKSHTWKMKFPVQSFARWKHWWKHGSACHRLNMPRNDEWKKTVYTRDQAVRPLPTKRLSILEA